MNYLELLASLGRTPEQMSAGTKTMMKKYEKIARLMVVDTETAAKLKPGKKQTELLAGVEDAKATLTDLNAVICEKIQHYHKHYDMLRAKGEALNASRIAKKTAAQATPPAEQTEPAAEEPPVEIPPVEEIVPPVQKEEPVKKKSRFGILGAFLITGILAVIGYGAYQNSKS